MNSINPIFLEYPRKNGMNNSFNPLNIYDEIRKDFPKCDIVLPVRSKYLLII